MSPDNLETLRAKLLHASTILAKSRRALEATPEYLAHSEARVSYEQAEEAFNEYGGAYEYAVFCEACGMPLKLIEAEFTQVGAAPEEAAPFCKDAAACNERSGARPKEQRA